MADLWGVIAELTTVLHPDRVVSVADSISRLGSVHEFDRLEQIIGPHVERESLVRLRDAWLAQPRFGPLEIAAALRAAAKMVASLQDRGSVELVWTGPRTGLIPTRHTEQVILEVLDSARSTVFLVSYVFHGASSIIEALNDCTRRGVDVRILLESSIDHGGSVRGDPIREMREAVRGATIYRWDPAARAIDGSGMSASVHAKCLVADRNLAFVTSANLTSAALERNMELGVVIRGGTIPDRLRSHLDALVATKVIVEWEG